MSNATGTDDASVLTCCSGGDGTNSSCPDNWRTLAKNALEQELLMLENSIQTDCRVSLQTSNLEPFKEYRLHRFVLCRASEVFQKMLTTAKNGSRMMDEADEPDIIITNVEPRIFNIVIKHMYSDRLVLQSFEECTAVAAVADKYQLPLLHKACERELVSMIYVETVWRAVALAGMLQGYDHLEEACLKFVCFTTEECLLQEDFLNCPEDFLIKVLQQDDLYVPSELYLVAAVIRWARNHTEGRTVRAVLEPRLLPLLRLLWLPHIALTLVDWLSEDEKKAIARKELDKLPESFCKSLRPVASDHSYCRRRTSSASI